MYRSQLGPLTRLSSRGKDAAGLIRTALSPAVAFLLLSAITRAGWISIQIVYSRETLIVDYFGPYFDTLLWVLLTITLGLLAAVDMARHVKESAYATCVFLALIGSVLAFGVAVTLNLKVPSIVAAALVYFMDLGVRPLRIRNLSLLNVKILGVSVGLVFASVLTIVAELGHPASARFPESTLPWLLSKATQLTLSVYHCLDPAAPLLYAALLLLSIILLLGVALHLDRGGCRNWSKPFCELDSSVALAVAVVLCGLGSMLLTIPYIAAGRPIGVDFNWYIDTVRELLETGAVHVLPSLSHPVVLLVMLAAAELFRVPSGLAVQLTTNLTALFAAISAGWFTLQMTRDRGTALLALLFSLFSVRTTVGYFAGLLANWFAMAEVFLALGLLARFLRDGRKRDLAFIIALNVLVFATHVEAWMMLSLLTLLIGLRRKELLVSMAVTLLVLVSVFVGNPAFVSLQARDLSVVASSFSLKNPSSLLSNLQTIDQFFVIGLFTDPVLLILSILGLACAGLGFKSCTSAFPLCAWTALAGFSVLFLGPSFAWRALYQVPYEILAALGVSVIWRECEARASARGLNSHLPTVVVLAIGLATIVNGIRGILVLVP